MPVKLRFKLELSRGVIGALTAIHNYFRPDGASTYRQPDGASLYIRP